MSTKHLKKTIAISEAAQNYADFLGAGGSNGLDLMVEHNQDRAAMIQEARENGWSCWKEWADLDEDEILAAIADYCHLDGCDVMDSKTGEELIDYRKTTATQLIEYVRAITNAEGHVDGSIFGIEGSVYLA